MKSKKNLPIVVQFNLAAMDKKQQETLHKIELLFLKIGIGFDVDYSSGKRNWYWDSLRGPVKVKKGHTA